MTMRKAQDGMIAAVQLALQVHQSRARREITRIWKRLPKGLRTRQALEALFELSMDPGKHEVLPLFPIDLLARGILAIGAAGMAQEYARLSRGLTPARFAEDPWAGAVRSFLAKDLIGAAEMETVLRQVELGIADGIYPNYHKAYQAAYQTAFSMVRESNTQILSRVRDILAQGLGQVAPGVGVPNSADLQLQMGDLYSALGLDPQEPWYAELVVNNAMNRAWQEGRDAISHDENGNPEDWVWGYSWHIGSAERHRPTHAAMDGHVAPKADPVWQAYGPPPIAHNCHCRRDVVTTDMAIRAGYIDRNESPLPGHDFSAPTLTRAQLDAAGFKPEDAMRYEGRPVTDVFTLPQFAGGRFTRSEFDSPYRAIFNPSGADGQGISAEAKAKLAAGNSAESFLAEALAKRMGV